MLWSFSHLVTFTLYFYREWTHSIVLGFQFAFMYIISYASSRTLGTAYGYSPIKIGFVTLSMGVGKFFLFQDIQTDWSSLLHLGNSGCIAGSVWGGRWSDYELARLKATNGGNSYPEVSKPWILHNVNPLHCKSSTVRLLFLVFFLWCLLFINL